MSDEIKALKIAVITLAFAWTASVFLLLLIIEDAKQECKLEQIK